MEKTLKEELQPSIVLTSLGDFQDYIIYNIRQLLLLEYNVYVITEKEFSSKFVEFFDSPSFNLVHASNLDLSYFNNKSELNKNYRNGFWHNASLRFFAIREWMRNYDMKHIVHLENDVLLYTKMLYNFGNYLYLVMDWKDRSVPGIIYIPSSEFLDDLCDNYNPKSHDMRNLAHFYHRNKNTFVKSFPIIDDSLKQGEDKKGRIVEINKDHPWSFVVNENFDHFGSIFDGASIGQYLCGVDPRNKAGDTSGFVNETCIVKYDNYSFKWVQKGQLYFPYIEINKKLIPINNLHMHCKNLEPYTIYNTASSKYIKKV